MSLASEHSYSPTSFSVPVTTNNTRPLRSNRGKGGAIAQLQAVANIITDTTKKKKTTNALKDIPLNVMAPAEKGR